MKFKPHFRLRLQCSDVGIILNDHVFFGHCWSNFGDPHLPGSPARFGKVSDRLNWSEQNINRAGIGQHRTQ